MKTTCKTNNSEGRQNDTSINKQSEELQASGRMRRREEVHPFKKKNSIGPLGQCGGQSSADAPYGTRYA